MGGQLSLLLERTEKLVGALNFELTSDDRRVTTKPLTDTPNATIKRMIGISKSRAIQVSKASRVIQVLRMRIYTTRGVDIFSGPSQNSVSIEYRQRLCPFSLYLLYILLSAAGGFNILDIVKSGISH